MEVLVQLMMPVCLVWNIGSCASLAPWHHTRYPFASCVGYVFGARTATAAKAMNQKLGCNGPADHCSPHQQLKIGNASTPSCRSRRCRSWDQGMRVQKYRLNEGAMDIESENIATKSLSAKGIVSFWCRVLLASLQLVPILWGFCTWRLTRFEISCSWLHMPCCGRCEWSWPTDLSRKRETCRRCWPKPSLSWRSGT